jgi:type I restriction enzyme S subunit
MWALADVCQIRPPKGEARQRVSDADLVSFVPMEDLGIGRKDLVSTQVKPLSEVVGSYTYFADGDVLLAKITPCFENGKLGIAAGLSNGIGFGSSEYVVFRPRQSIDKDWLYYFLSRESFRKEGAKRMSGAVGHKRVSKEFIEAYPIPLPPLAEQKRIVAILDEAFEGIAAAVANAEKNLANARELFEATIVTNLFGDPTGQGWRLTSVENLAAVGKGNIRTGPFGSQLLHGEFVDEGVAVLGIDNAVDNEFRWAKRRFITPSKYDELSRYTVKPGDVLITIMGTCGRCAVVPDDIPLAINSKHLCCITLDRKQCLPEFLHAYFLYHPVARSFLASRAKGSIMEGLNMGIIKELPVWLPDIPTQTQIISKIAVLTANVRAFQAVYEQKICSLSELKQAILQKAFAGELTAQPEKALQEAAAA